MDKRIIFAAVIVVIVCVVVVFLGTMYAPSPGGGGGGGGGAGGTYKISGYVKAGGVALSEATVTLDGQSTLTNSTGYYEFTGLAGSDNYTVNVSKTGYESYSGTVQLGTADAAVSDITLKVTATAVPLTEIKSALATQEGVPADNVEIYFYDLAAETDNFAIGAIVSGQKSIVFIYTQSTNGISVKDNYTATTADEENAMNIVTTKQPISRYPPGHKIVPMDFVNRGAEWLKYSFNYYDSYTILGTWGFGTAYIDAAGDIPENEMTHAFVV